MEYCKIYTYISELCLELHELYRNDLMVGIFLVVNASQIQFNFTPKSQQNEN